MIDQKNAKSIFFPAFFFKYRPANEANFIASSKNKR